MSVLECIIESNQGYITYNQVKDADIPYGDIIKKLNPNFFMKYKKTGRIPNSINGIYDLFLVHPMGENLSSKC